MHDNDDDLIEEPVHSYTTEVRDLFGASIITDLVIEHSGDCDVQRAKSENEYQGTEVCRCEPTTYFYVGRRADQESGATAKYIAGPCLSLADLETFCRKSIDRYRAAAKQNA